MYEEDEDQVVGSYAIYFAEGESLAKQGEYKKAIESFTKALEFRNEDQACLVARSKCYLQLGSTKAALEDAESSLKDDAKYHRGLYQKAEALYQMGDFEYSLVFYHRGNKIRPDLQEFKLGIQKAQEAIKNSIGTPDNCKLEKKGDLSFFKQQDVVSKKKNTKAAKVRAQAKAKDKEPVASEKTMKELLGELYADREYLDQLSKDPGLVNDKRDNGVLTLVQDGIGYLDSRTEFWRQQKPIYTRKREKEMKKWRPQPTKPLVMVGGSGKRHERGMNEGIEHTEYVLKQLDDIEYAVANGDIERGLRLSESTLTTVLKLSEDNLPNKQQFIATLHSCIGSAYLEMGDNTKAMEQFTIDQEIAETENYIDCRGRAYYNIGKVHLANGDYDKAIEVWKQRLPLIQSPLDYAWIYHEIGRAYSEVFDYDNAKEYGTRSLDAAHDAMDSQWQLNATILIAQAHVKLKEFNEASSLLKNSLDLAATLKDTKTHEAIKKRLEYVNSQITDVVD